MTMMMVTVGPVGNPDESGWVPFLFDDDDDDDRAGSASSE